MYIFEALKKLSKRKYVSLIVCFASRTGKIHYFSSFLFLLASAAEFLPLLLFRLWEGPPPLQVEEKKRERKGRDAARRLRVTHARGGVKFSWMFYIYGIPCLDPVLDAFVLPCSTKYNHKWEAPMFTSLISYNCILDTWYQAKIRKTNLIIHKVRMKKGKKPCSSQNNII